MKLSTAVLCFFLYLIGTSGQAAERKNSSDAEMSFITRRGDQLFDGSQPFRFISFNIPNLLVIEDAYEFTKPNPWRWPNEFEIEDALESVRQVGGQVVRTYVVSVRREGSDMEDIVHVLGPGEFNDEGFRAMDVLLDVARRKGIRVVIPLVDQHKWWGGIAEYAAFRGKPADAFWTDRQIIDDFKSTVRHVITRKNSISGIAYRDDRAIFGWQTGNEISSTPEWTREIAAYIKELDPNHLVLDGKSLQGVPVWSLDDPNIDVISTHHYPWGTDHDYVKPIREAHALTKGKKAYFVGEFGFVETPHMASAMDAVIEDGISGALVWSLRMHRREGGFYWHMEVGTGKNIYKAYHWPGFPSGDRYDERKLLKLIQQKAHEIRGIEPTKLEPPAAPTLLPINRVSAISWQGSAGASGYDISRTESPDGEWQKIAEDVSDADVQYQPLFNDDAAIPGRHYFYRAQARNSAGVSAPSNVIGPIRADCRTLVDECRNFAKTNATAVNVSLATENARTTQEDSHRFAMNPDSSVIYSVDGRMDSWRVYAFARDVSSQLEFAISNDGEEFVPIDSAKQSYPSGQTVYGYLTPVLFTGQNKDDGARFLRIRIPPANTGEKKSREAPIEIARLEIEYDRVANSELPPESAARTDRATPANGTIFIDNPRYIRDALSTIDKVAASGDRRLNVAITILVDLTKDLRIKSYGWSHGSERNYEPCDDSMHKSLKEALRRVFSRMVEHGMDIFILPHIDPGGHVSTWRNWVDFDPRVRYDGYSYEQLMIGSIADALAATVKPGTRVELALSGEMGTSLFRYPESYRSMVQDLRNRPELKGLKIGISLNHSGISGQNNPTGAEDIELTDNARRQLQSLIHESDFVGMSFYRPVNVQPTTDDFVRGIDHFMSEFARHGLEVPTTKPMHFSEVGIGGGFNDDRVAASPAKAVESPWAGSGDERANPWQAEPMRDLRRQYHDALLQVLATQPAKWNVSAAFFWSTGSWDPQGLRHPAFADPEIITAIKVHNETAARRSAKSPVSGQNGGPSKAR